MSQGVQPTEHTGVDHWHVLQEAVLTWFLLLGSGGSAFAIGMILVFSPENRGRIFLLFVALTFMATSWFILRKGHLQISSRLVIAGMSVVLIIGPISGIGIYTLTYVAHLILIMMVGILYSTRVTIFFTAGSIAFGSILVAMANAGTIDAPQNVPLSPLIAWVALSSIFAITASLIIAIRIATRNIIDQIEQDRIFYRTIIRDQSELIVRWKPDGRRTFANDAYCRYFGLTPEEIVGTSVTGPIPEEGHSRFYAKLKRITPENPVEIDQSEVIRPDGSIGWQQWTDRGIFDSEGNLTEYQSVGRDITPLVKLEQNQLNLEMATRREQFLRDFLNMISHDLKTPLTIMENNLYLIRHTSVTPAVEKHANRIERQIEHLTVMINDILTVARLENVERLSMQSVGLGEIVNRSMQSLQDAYEAKDIVLTVMEPLDHISIKADEKYLKRAIVNLLENAIKYSPECSSVTISGSSDREQRATLTIADEGIGIAEDDLPHIFEPFYRAKDARGLERGSGLGLAIVNRVVELHGGTVSVESTPGKGTTFTLKLPLYQEKNGVPVSAPVEA